MLKISKKIINIKIENISLSLKQIEDKKRHERCPICNNRLDNIVSIPGEVINDILNNFIKHIETNKFKDLDKAKLSYFKTVLKRYKNEK